MLQIKGRTSVEESIFWYDDGLSQVTFSFPDFEPTFIDEANPDLVHEAEGICGTNAQCVFDYIVTGNRDLAVETATTEEVVTTVTEELSTC